MAPEPCAPLNLKLFKLRSHGRETLVHDTFVRGCMVSACDLQPGCGYRLYGFSSETGPLQPIDVELPDARHWAADSCPTFIEEQAGTRPEAAGPLRRQLHLMLRPDRLQQHPRFPQLRSGERFVRVFSDKHLPGSGQHGTALRRFRGLLRLEGNCTSERLIELALALEQRADVAYCSLDPCQVPWSAQWLSALMERIRPGAVVAMPWRYPLDDGCCAPIAHSRLIWDLQRACFQTDATVFFSAKAGDGGLPRWGDTGAVPVMDATGEAIEALARRVSQAQRRFNRLYPGSYLPPSLVRDCFGVGFPCGGGVKAIEAAVSGAAAVGG